ncbi:MAG: hypothetical protein RBS10_16445 [Thauera propionica]|jgi:hypothetical protein|uniref:Lipoprotein SmpA/OmlA domain-containing protein n=1 Tax=Thauera propionica TaxID=2019431 RepID=A0A235F260_9RHOO|nr:MULTISPECIES: hypothetical protein [Thauera]MDD3675180.1 hypothetical protein [Thauera propionica]MDI3491598.1 hypothetical protein [Thauera sp.]MDY0049009.1 hypothetical protein [Thauera propionica]OYD55311.1 hypothetical protein CGK74_03705 [Thauera propionica]
MKRLLAWLCALLSAVGITACDYFNLRELKPGVSTAMEVRERFGPPRMEWKNEDGSVTWEYTRQPEGIECFMITIGPDDILRQIDQVLNEQNFARVVNGMNGDEVRRLLGKPARSQFFQLKHETVWEWKISHGFAGTSEPVFFTVSFNTDGRVVGTGRYTQYRR